MNWPLYDHGQGYSNYEIFSPIAVYKLSMWGKANKGNYVQCVYMCVCVHVLISSQYN